MRRRLGTLAAILVLLAAVLAAPVQALRSTGWADWGPLAGSSNAYTTTLRLPAKGFPAAAVTSDSRSGSVGVQSGASVWFGPTTPVGATYGSSQNRPYLNLRPQADTATTPSTTTYVFDTPTPPTGWAFILGDIDADQVKVTAKDAVGEPVTAAQLGFAGGFNLCDFTPRPSGCSASVGDAPVWNPATSTLTGNPAAADTFGATGWFQPTVALSSLTFTFTRRSGFPVYQTWFASTARTISGTVDDVSTGGGSCPPGGVTVRLTGPDGTSLATTTPDSGGAYSFGEYATQPGYLVSVEPPGSCAVVGAEARTVSTASADAVADFEVRQILPQPISGRVTAGGAGLADVAVTLHLPGGGTRVTTTEADGSYLFDDNAIGTGYFVTIAVPAGYSGADQRAPVDVVDQPVTGQDFALTANPNVSGTVTGGGNALGGVTVTLTPSGGGAAITTVTGGDGSYTFERVPPGTYDISVDPPPGYTPAPPRTGVVVSDDVTGQDFTLDRLGALGGTVHLDTGAGPGRAGVVIEVTGPGGTRRLTTDAQGDYFLPSLPPGGYRIRIEVPAGYDGVGALVRTVTITAEGEIRGGQDFVISRTTVSPTPTTPATPTPAPGVTSPSSGVLPDTGSDDLGALSLLALALLLLGAALTRASTR